VAGEGPTAFWPLLSLVVRTPRLELRLPREEEFPGLVELVDAGIHDPETMPFFIPWTDVEPRRRAWGPSTSVPCGPSTRGRGWAGPPGKGSGT
jgi:hypothetical protein